MNFEIAIPSFKRAGILQERTLKMLEGCDAPIVVYCETEVDKYIYELSGITLPIEVSNTKGIGEKRNHIIKRGYEKGLDFIVMLDDDLKYLIDGDSCRYTGEMVIDVIKKGYEEAVKNDLRLFGICCYNNSFYLKNNVSTNLKFIAGAFTGLVLKGDPIFTPVNTLEDYYRTLQHFKTDNGILRLNYYGMNVNFATAKGGLQEMGELRKQEEEQNATFIVEKFGEKMVKKRVKKRGIDLRLNNYYKNPEQATE